GFLLLVSLALSAGLSVLARMWGPRDATAWVLESLNFLFSFALVTVLFAMISALLFNVGKFAIGLYLGNSAIGSTYGAAGSVILILVWVYYSAQIFLL